MADLSTSVLADLIREKRSYKPESVAVKHASISKPDRGLQMLLNAAGSAWTTSILAFLRSPPCDDPSAGVDIELEFARFAESEAARSGLNIEHLVLPTGDFSKRGSLLVNYHYPTFNTKTAQFGPSADPTNACTRSTLRKGLDPYSQNICQIELYWRRTNSAGRKSKKTPYAGRPEVDLHTEFSRLCHRVLNPRVCLVVGAWVRKSYLQSLFPAQKIETIMVPCTDLPETDCDHVIVHIVHDNQEILQIGVECPHPESLLFRNEINKGYYVDRCVQLAVELAGLEIPINERYFEKFVENHITPTNEQKRPAMNQEGPENGQKKPKIGQDARESDQEEPHSGQKMPEKAQNVFRQPSGIYQLIHWENQRRQADPPQPFWQYEELPGFVMTTFTKFTGKEATKENMEELLPSCPEYHASLAKVVHILMFRKGNEKYHKNNSIKEWEVESPPTEGPIMEAIRNQGKFDQAEFNRQRKRDREAGVPYVRLNKAEKHPCPYKPLGCTNRDLTQEAMMIHVQAEHMDVRWVCKWPGCHFPYKSPKQLNNHVRDVHKGQKIPPQEE